MLWFLLLIFALCLLTLVMPYRVLVVTNMWPNPADPSYGGFVKAQMESLKPLGVEYDVVFINGRESLWNYLGCISEMRRRLRSACYDLIHAHFGLSGWVARCQLRVPVAVTFHGDDVLGRFRRNGSMALVGHLFRISSFVLARLVAAVIVQSRQMKSKLKLASAAIIPCGVDLNLFQPQDRDEARGALGLDRRKRFILFPFDPSVENKRFDLIEAAVAQAKAEMPELEILQVSGVPRDRMPLYMNAADVLVLASHSEGSPNVVKEALATNLPLITTDVGDAAELIGSSPGNYVVPREAEAVAAKIVEACRTAFRARGREQIEQLSLSMESVAKRVLAVYAGVLRR